MIKCREKERERESVMLLDYVWDYKFYIYVLFIF